jgi:hypothetical protein
MSNTPELFGFPIATLAFCVAGAGFLLSLVALGWQVAKHVLDGGRVKVYLNAAIWEPDVMIDTNRSGRWKLQAERYRRAGPENFEAAQLVVENPGRTAITVYSPGLAIKGGNELRDSHQKPVSPPKRKRAHKHTISPRTFEGGDFGADSASTESVVRLEPYSRVTFLFDYWSIVPGLLSTAGARGITLRGFVSVAGRTKRPQKSSWRLRWRIKQGAWTSVRDLDAIAPRTVIWREVYRHGGVDAVAEGNAKLKNGILGFVVEGAMRNFHERPSREDFQAALVAQAKELGETYPVVGFAALVASESLDRLEGHLMPWSSRVIRPKSAGSDATDIVPPPVERDSDALA